MYAVGGRRLRPRLYTSRITPSSSLCATQRAAAAATPPATRRAPAAAGPTSSAEGVSRRRCASEQARLAVADQQRLEDAVAAHGGQVVGMQQRCLGVVELTVQGDDDRHGHTDRG